MEVFFNRKIAFIHQIGERLNYFVVKIISMKKVLTAVLLALFTISSYAQVEIATGNDEEDDRNEIYLGLTAGASLLGNRLVPKIGGVLGYSFDSGRRINFGVNSLFAFSNDQNPNLKPRQYTEYNLEYMGNKLNPGAVRASGFGLGYIDRGNGTNVFRNMGKFYHKKTLASGIDVEAGLLFNFQRHIYLPYFSVYF